MTQFVYLNNCLSFILFGVKYEQLKYTIHRGNYVLDTRGGFLDFMAKHVFYQMFRVCKCQN